MSEMDTRVTMKEVAAAAGVHQTTVSLALRNHPSIPEETRARIRRIADEIGYRRNPLVSALMAIRRTGLPGHGARLAFLTVCKRPGQWRKESPNYSRLFDLIALRANSLGYALEEFWFNDPSVHSDRLRQILLHRGIRGLILCPLPGKQHELALNFSDFATVALRYTLRNPALDHVSIDYCAAMDLTLDRLRQSGHRRIVFVTTGEIDERVNHLSLGAYLARRQLDPEIFMSPQVAPEWTRETFIRHVASRNPDAVVAPGHRLHDCFARWLKNDGRDLPRDLSLVTLDCRFGLEEAGILQNLEGEAHAVVELVTSRVERAQFGVPSGPQTVLLKGNWKTGVLFQDRKISIREKRGSKPS